jgi:hypothetical protein
MKDVEINNMQLNHSVAPTAMLERGNITMNSKSGYEENIGKEIKHPHTTAIVVIHTHTYSYV